MVIEYPPVVRDESMTATTAFSLKLIKGNAGGGK